MMPKINRLPSQTLQNQTKNRIKFTKHCVHCQLILALQLSTLVSVHKSLAMKTVPKQSIILQTILTLELPGETVLTLYLPKEKLAENFTFKFSNLNPVSKTAILQF